MPFNETQFLHGSPRMVDHTPTVAIAAGTVVVTADTPRIAHLDIPANTLGALAAVGGVYQCVGDAAIAADKKVYWDNTNNKVTETAAGNKVFGVTVTACAANNGYCQVRHDPAA
jgi:predicted RecA/RadA family phage recombinase